MALTNERAPGGVLEIALFPHPGAPEIVTQFYAYRCTGSPDGVTRLAEGGTLQLVYFRNRLSSMRHRPRSLFASGTFYRFAKVARRAWHRSATRQSLLSAGTSSILIIFDWLLFFGLVTCFAKGPRSFRLNGFCFVPPAKNRHIFLSRTDRQIDSLCCSTLLFLG